MELIQDKMQDFMTYFHKETHYTIVSWAYNARVMYVNMEIWDEFHKVGILAKCAEEFLIKENYEKIKNYLVAYMRREEINVYGVYDDKRPIYKRIKKGGVVMDRYVFHCEDGHNYICRKGQCLCCIHCTDIYWDYSHGPYMIICKKDMEPNGDCNQWELDDSLDKYEESEENKE